MRALSRSSSCCFDALGQADQLAERHVERLLGPLGAGAGVAEHAAAVAQRVVRGVDAVAQAAALADLGEQPGAHAAAQHAHRAPGLEVVGMAVGHAGVGDADLRLVRIVAAGARSGRSAGDSTIASARPRLPVAEQLADQVLQPLPVEAAGHAEDRAVGAVAPLEMLADVVDA